MSVSFEFLKKEKKYAQLFYWFSNVEKWDFFSLIFKHGKVFLQLQSHINPVLHRLLGCILPTCQLCKSYFAEKQTSGNGSASVTLHFLNHHHASGLRRVGLGTEEQRFLSVINCLQFCTGKPLYHTIWDPFFASTNPPLSVSME